MSSKKSRILIVFGTRPEAIKMAPIAKKLIQNPNFVTKVCSTGQHRQMLDQVLGDLQIHADYDLNIMKKSQTLTSITSDVINAIEPILNQWRPNIMLVHGDTTTTLSASLAAFYKRVSVGHVEAGLRTGDMYSPWPEEINRKLVSSIATIHFAPTDSARRNLLKEDICDSKIFVTGNTVIDSLLEMAEKIENDEATKNRLKVKFNFLATQKKLILVTVHRRENFGDKIISICNNLLEISKREDVQLVYPVHLNPNITEPVHRILGSKPNIHLIGPQDYPSFVYLMKRSTLILTDSGGIQEEAPSLSIPVLVLRDETERPEALQAGTVRLVGSNAQMLKQNTYELLDDVREYQLMAASANPYGDGKAADRIVRILETLLCDRRDIK